MLGARTVARAGARGTRGACGRQAAACKLWRYAGLVHHPTHCPTPGRDTNSCRAARQREQRDQGQAGAHMMRGFLSVPALRAATAWAAQRRAETSSSC